MGERFLSIDGRSVKALKGARGWVEGDSGGIVDLLLTNAQLSLERRPWAQGQFAPPRPLVFRTRYHNNLPAGILFF